MEGKKALLAGQMFFDWGYQKQTILKALYVIHAVFGMWDGVIIDPQSHVPHQAPGGQSQHPHQISVSNCPFICYNCDMHDTNTNQIQRRIQYNKEWSQPWTVICNVHRWCTTFKWASFSILHSTERPSAILLILVLLQTAKSLGLMPAVFMCYDYEAYSWWTVHNEAYPWWTVHIEAYPWWTVHTEAYPWCTVHTEAYPWWTVHIEAYPDG